MSGINPGLTHLYTRLFRRIGVLDLISVHLSCIVRYLFLGHRIYDLAAVLLILVQFCELVCPAVTRLYFMRLDLYSVCKKVDCDLFWPLALMSGINPGLTHLYTGLFRHRCTQFLITYLKGMRTRNNFHLNVGVFLFNQFLYFIRLCCRICIENEVISMLGIIRFINLISIRSLCFHEFICNVWRRCSAVQRCKPRESKLSVTIRRFRAHLCCFRDGSSTRYFQFI